MINANIFDIKRFGINDGSGIRTVLFVKGCPLRCKWCHNPEGISHDIRLWRMIGRCVNCNGCIASCTRGALCADEQGIRIDDTKCDLCGDCVSACATGAMQPDAVNMSVDDAMKEIERDEVFFGENGGVTLSGGECTASPEFSLAVLRACRERGINTAIETCLHAPPHVMDQFAEAADSVIADIKLIDPERHKEATGVDNALILRNFEWLARRDGNLIVRIPLIPGYTADEENLKGIAEYIASISLKVPVEMINFNPMCTGKYAAMRRDFITGAPTHPYTCSQMEAFAKIISDHRLQVKY